MWIKCSSLELSVMSTSGIFASGHQRIDRAYEMNCTSGVKKLRGTETNEFQATSNNHTYQPT
jgi:hypothetical protein